MAPPLCIISECWADDDPYLDPSHSFPMLMIDYFTFPVETRARKRLRTIPSTDESSFGQSSSFCKLPRLQFRDHVWAYNRRFLAIEAMDEASVAMFERLENGEPEEDKNDVGVKLVQQLIACAEAVACRDKAQASALLPDLRANALVFGTSFQRVASCFVQGLSNRFAPIQIFGSVGLVNENADHTIISGAAEDKNEGLNLVYDICPQIQFGHFVANASILEVLEGENNSIHVVDLGMTQGLSHGHQWRSLIYSLANQKPTPRLRITGVGISGKRLEAIGDELKQYAEISGVDFEFLMVEKNLENLKTEDFNLKCGEILVINSILELHCAVKESRGALNSVLQMLQGLSPKLFVLIEQESSHNGPFFLGRFMEALHYYSAIFDSIDAMLPMYDTRRAKMEQFYYAEEIKNIVSCEGLARVERHEKMEKWRRRMSRARFVLMPLNKMMAQVNEWMRKFSGCEGYEVLEEKGCLVIGWKGNPIVAASCWKCS